MMLCFCIANAYSNDWAIQAQHDLKKTNAIINKYDPYKYVDFKSPYAEWINRGYTEAYKQAALAYDWQSYEKALLFYSNGFKIEHLYLSFDKQILKKKNAQLQHTTTYVASLMKVGKDIVLLKLPSFEAGNNSTLKKSLISITKNITKYRDKKYLIVDLRGNSGGQATYARLLIRRFYGDNFLMSLGPNFIWNKKWTSTDILSPQLIKYISNIKNDPQVKVDLAAHKLKKKSISLSYWPAYAYKPHPAMKDPVESTIILLTDNHCYSMCYQLSRTWLSLAHVYLVGKQPNTMGLITNPIAFPISKYSTLSLASRIMTDPIDAFNRPLKPSYTYDGNIKDSKAVYQWVYTLIKDDKFINLKPSS